MPKDHHGPAVEKPIGPIEVAYREAVLSTHPPAEVEGIFAEPGNLETFAEWDADFKNAPGLRAFYADLAAALGRGDTKRVSRLLGALMGVTRVRFVARIGNCPYCGGIETLKEYYETEQGQCSACGRKTVAAPLQDCGSEEDH